MKKEKRRISYTKMMGMIGIAAILGLVLYCMINHLGLIDSLDFGAGAYYYADIPEFNKYVNGDVYQSETPMWILVVLFLAWGGMMYRLWSWIEKKQETGEKQVLEKQEDTIC